MRAWVDFVRATPVGRVLWPEEFQFGGLAGPRRPTGPPWRAKTDAVLWPRRPTSLNPPAWSVGGARVLGRAELRRRVRSSSPTRLRAAVPGERHGERPGQLRFGHGVRVGRHVRPLRERGRSIGRAGARIASFSAGRGYHVSTGFVGTPLVLPALSAVGDTKLLPAPHRDGVSVLALPGDDGSDDDVGALGRHVARRIHQPRRNDVVQSLCVGGVADWMHRPSVVSAPRSRATGTPLQPGARGAA